MCEKGGGQRNAVEGEERKSSDEDDGEMSGKFFFLFMDMVYSNLHDVEREAKRSYTCLCL